MSHRRLVPATLAACLVLWAVETRAQGTDAFFDDNTLHDVQLWLHGDDWLRLREAYRENTYYPADLTWNGIRLHNVGIRSRGNASRDANKPGLRVDIDRYVSGQRFLGLKSFVLDNSTQDASLLKQRLAMRVFARMGIPAPRQAHARLFVNGAYAGLYLLVESVDKDLIERAYEERSARIGRRERDGVLLDYRWIDPYYFTYLGADLAAYAARFEAQTHERASFEFLYGPLRDLTRVIDEAPDDRFVEFANRLLDVAQWVRYVAVENVLAENDGMLGFAGMNNFYLYRYDNDTVSQVIPWDKDQSFDSATRSIWENAETNALMRRAMRVPEYRALYLRTLAETAQTIGAPAESDARGWLEREAGRVLAQIREAALADPAKPWTNEQFLQEAARVQEVRAPARRSCCARSPTRPWPPATASRARRVPRPDPTRAPSPVLHRQRRTPEPPPGGWPKAWPFPRP
jgi:hypothetical protein